MHLPCAKRVIRPSGCPSPHLAASSCSCVIHAPLKRLQSTSFHHPTSGLQLDFIFCFDSAPIAGLEVQSVVPCGAHVHTQGLFGNCPAMEYEKQRCSWLGVFSRQPSDVCVFLIFLFFCLSACMCVSQKNIHTQHATHLQAEMAVHVLPTYTWTRMCVPLTSSWQPEQMGNPPSRTHPSDSRSPASGPCYLGSSSAAVLQEFRSVQRKRINKPEAADSGGDGTRTQNGPRALGGRLGYCVPAGERCFKKIHLPEACRVTKERKRLKAGISL